MQWAINVYRVEARDNVVLESFDSRFRCIHTVIVWLHYLDVGAIALDEGFDCIRSFVVENMELWLEVFSF